MLKGPLFFCSEAVSDLFICRGVPDYVRSDNGPEFTAHRARDWLASVEVKTLFIEPGSPWENGYVESFNGKLHDELLIREVFDTLPDHTARLDSSWLGTARSGP